MVGSTSGVTVGTSGSGVFVGTSGCTVFVAGGTGVEPPTVGGGGWGGLVAGACGVGVRGTAARGTHIC